MHDKLLSRPYICGIGGIGMSGVAHLCIDMRIRVAGSDLRRSVLTEDLERRGAIISYEPQPQRVQNASCIIAPSSFPATHPELEAARDSGVERLSRTRALARICRAAESAPNLCFGTTARAKLTWLVSSEYGFGWCAGAVVANSRVSRHAVLSRRMMLDIDEREFLADPEAFSDFSNMDILVSDWQDGFGYYNDDIRPERFVKTALSVQNGGFLVMPEKSTSPERIEFSLWQENHILERFAFELDFARGLLKSPKAFGFDDVPLYGSRFDASAVAAAQTWLYARKKPGLTHDIPFVGWFSQIANRQYHEIRMHPVNVRNAVDSLKSIAAPNPIHVAIKPFSSTLKRYKPEYWRQALANADHIYIITPPYEGCCGQDCLDFAKELQCPSVEVMGLNEVHRRVLDSEYWLWIGADDLV